MAHNLTNLVQSKVIPGLYNMYIQGATTSWMENNSVGVEYRGGKYVYMTEMEVDGLANYDRALGYVRGNVTGSKKQYEMTMDRGRDFLIDYADYDETGYLLSVANVMAKFQREHVIPEIDCYRYSKIYSIINTENPGNISDEAIDAKKITEMLADDISDLQDQFGMDVPLRIIMSGKTQKYLGREWIHNLNYGEMKVGNVNLKIKSLDGNPFDIVPSARLKSAYIFNDGVTGGQEAGGFKAKSDAKDIKWIITPASAPVAVMKIDKSRTFSPDEYPDAHAWKTDYRVFHDLWMLPKGVAYTKIRTGAITEV